MPPPPLVIDDFDDFEVEVEVEDENNKHRVCLNISVVTARHLNRFLNGLYTFGPDHYALDRFRRKLRRNLHKVHPDYHPLEPIH